MLKKCEGQAIIVFDGFTGTLQEIAKAKGVSYHAMRVKFYRKFKCIADVAIGYKKTERKPMKPRVKKEKPPKPPKEPIECTCVECGTVFTAMRKHSLCSDECRRNRANRAARKKQKLQSLAKPEKVIKTCTECGTLFEVSKFQSHRKICSTECAKKRAIETANRHRIKKLQETAKERELLAAKKIADKQRAIEAKDALLTKSCVMCGSPFKAKLPHAKYCSERCSKRQGRERDKRRTADRLGHEYLTSEDGVCADCGTPLKKPRPHGTRFCCSKCSRRAGKRKAYLCGHRKARRAISGRLRDVIRKRGGCKSNSAMKYVGCSMQEMVAHLESGFNETMNWDNYGVFGWHVDHVVPCAAFDLTREDHLELCFNINNLRPLWHTENNEKNDALRDCDIESLDLKYLERLKQNGIIEIQDNQWLVCKRNAASVA